MLFIPEFATPEPALSGSERARNDIPFCHCEARPLFCHCEERRAEAIPRSNPKLKALNSKQILISKFKTQNPFLSFGFWSFDIV